MIPYTPITSSNIRAIAYANGLTHIEFKSGRRFAWSGLSAEQFSDLQTAKSAGGYFAKYIKGNAQYPVAWSGWRCDLSPCEKDATVQGAAAGTKFYLCPECAKGTQYRSIALTPLEQP